MESVARALADALVRGEPATAPPPHAPRRAFALGDPQAPASRVFANLARHGLLADDGWLARDVELLSAGDHFDFDPRAHPGCDPSHDGRAVLAWLAAHSPAQVTILLGNHDVARVQEFSDATDDRVAAMRAAPDAQLPELPAPGLVTRDYMSFTTAQRAQVQQLLLANRFSLGATATLAGRPVAITHAGVTTRELALLGLAGDAQPLAITRALAAALDRAVAAVRDAWLADRPAALDLAPLHVPGAKARDDAAVPEGGGLLYHRPNDPLRAVSPWEYDTARPRRFDPRTLPRGLAQVAGHTNDPRCRRALARWLAPELPPHASLRTLSVTGDDVLYRAVVDPHAPTALILIDPEMHARAEVELLGLDPGSLRRA
jgi:hypothetical protein|nr:hypothetical protein [Kofleriaceae bacterium]